MWNFALHFATLCTLFVGGYMFSGYLEKYKPEDENKYFLCSEKSGVLIGKVFLCDTEKDCPDGEDESAEQQCSSSCTGPNQFACTTGNQCISKSYECDGIADCGDESDEEHCAVRACGTPAQCIARHHLCDWKFDIPSGMDEKRCPMECNSDEFACSQGSCIEAQYKCDGVAQCPDASDEFNCYACPGYPGIFIEDYFVCDTVPDCPDGAEEKNCPEGCDGPNQFMCKNGQCTSKHYRCDGEKDCSDGSDERKRLCGELEHPEGTKLCGLGGIRSYYETQYECDGFEDCETGADERRACKKTECKRNQFKCAASSKCISSKKRCDGITQCTDHSDEFNCTYPGFFVCPGSAGIKVKEEFKCDTVEDCPGGTDETDCPTDCAGPNQFQCKDSSCISKSRKCDSEADCDDGSDEDENICLEYTAADGRKHLNACLDKIQFRCNDGTCISRANVCEGKLSDSCQDGSAWMPCFAPMNKDY